MGVKVLLEKMVTSEKWLNRRGFIFRREGEGVIESRRLLGLMSEGGSIKRRGLGFRCSGGRGGID
jgi:hypothetical protein